ISASHLLCVVLGLLPLLLFLLLILQTRSILFFKEAYRFVNQKSANRQNKNGDAGALQHVASTGAGDVLERIKKCRSGDDSRDDEEEEQPTPRSAPIHPGAGGAKFALEQDAAKPPGQGRRETEGEHCAHSEFEFQIRVDLFDTVTK